MGSWWIQRRGALRCPFFLNVRARYDGHLRSKVRCRIHDEALFSRFGDEKPGKLVKTAP